MTDSGDSRPGIKAAGDAMQAMREWLHAEQLVATFAIDGHDLDLIADELGIGLYHDGEEVPMKDGR